MSALGVWCNGSTEDFESFGSGSNPDTLAVAVADMVMHRIVAPDDAGSTPVGHLFVLFYSKMSSFFVFCELPTTCSREVGASFGALRR